MELRFSEDVEEYAAAVIPFLEAAPADRNVPRTVIEQVRRSAERYAAAPSFWWCIDDAGAVAGTAQWTPPFPLLVTEVPQALASRLARAVLERSAATAVPLNGVHGPSHAARRLGDALRATGITVTEHALLLMQECTLVTPVPEPEGRRRPAGQSEAELFTPWITAFGIEARTSVPDDPTPWLRDQARQGQLDVWEVRGSPVSLTGYRFPVAGTVRIGPVYTPPEHRGRGYGRRLVAEVTAGWLATPGVSRCMLFADSANPVSNSIYAQIGYRVTGEHVELRCASPAPELRDRVTIRQGTAP